MKNLIIIAIALVTIQGIAQGQKKEGPNNQERTQRMNDLTPEEAANLHTKKMTLHLDLNDKQQKAIYKINLENATLRNERKAAFKSKKESGQVEKPSKEQRLAMQNAKLDHQIANKAKMKTILTADQFSKWEQMQAKMAHREKGKRKGDGQKQGGQKQKQQ